MKTKIIIFLAAISIIFLTEFDNSYASNCAGRCGLMCTANENVSKDAFEYCDNAGEQCCKPKSECDPTMPGCGDTASAKAPATVGNRCGSPTFQSFCEAGSFFCSTGRTRDFTRGSVSCVSGAICCRVDSTVTTATPAPTTTTNNSGLNGGSGGTAPVQGGSGGTAPVQGGSGGTPVAGTGVYIPTAEETGLPAPAGGIQDILKNLLIWLLEIVGVIALIGFVISGIQYNLAAGDEKMAETAKKNMTYAITGIVVVLASFVIIKAIDYALRGSSTSF